MLSKRGMPLDGCLQLYLSLRVYSKINCSESNFECFFDFPIQETMPHSSILQYPKESRKICLVSLLLALELKHKRPVKEVL